MYRSHFQVGDVVKIVADGETLLRELSIDFGSFLLDSLGVVTEEIDNFDLTIDEKHVVGLPGICVHFEVNGVDWYFPNCKPFVSRYLERA